MPDETGSAGELDPVEPLKGDDPGRGIEESADDPAEASAEPEEAGREAQERGREKDEKIGVVRGQGGEEGEVAAESEDAERPRGERSRHAANDLPPRSEIAIHPPTAKAAPAEPADRSDAGTEKPATRTPERGRIRRFERGPRVPWWRSVLPALGLALCLVCLWKLMSLGPIPAWRFGGKQPEIVGKGLVVIDPGHGGGDSGAVAQGVVEKDLNLDVGLRVGRALRARGIDVRLTREDDHFVPLEDRVRFANALPGAVFVSIHFNDAAGEGKANPQASGIETYYCQQKLTAAQGGWRWAALLGRGKIAVPDARWAVQEGQTLASCIQGTLIAGTGAENRGTKERSLYVTHRVLGPAVLVEGGFVSHPGEARKLGDPTYRQVLAECIAEGIVKYLRAAQTAPAASANP